LRKLEIIHRSGNHLLDLINSVLELARIEAGRVHLQEETCHIDLLLKELAAAFQVKAEKAGLQFVLTANDVAYSVTVDAEKLRQVLNNLLDNAIKFTEQGRVELCVRAGRSNGELLRLEFVISDTGIGVTPDDLPRIFEPFVQLNADATSAGTGLGLPITQQYLLMMGSRLSAQSTLGKGSVFSFVLDLPLVGEPSVVAAPELNPQRETVALSQGAVGVEDITALPDSLRSALRDAVSELNPEKMKRVLAQLEAEQTQLAQGISSMIEALRYQELWALLAVNE
jgi:anti-sigma regulatory factor (Ser/Thr protein kinase)